MEICTNDITICIASKEKQNDLTLSNHNVPLSEDTSAFIPRKLFTTPIISGIQLALKSKTRQCHRTL